MNRYLVFLNKPWCGRIFDETIQHYPGEWRYWTTNTYEYISDFRYIFFLHWSHKVPNKIIKNHECINFHMTDLPYGRAGSPLQNLILRGHKTTVLTAHHMTTELDAGPIYLQESLSLDGNAEQIYVRATELAARMIKYIVRREPKPVPQKTILAIPWSRRKPAQSVIPTTTNLGKLYDFIRMLDAEGYPPAFLDYNGLRYSFSRAGLYDGRIIATVKVTKI